MAPRDPFRAPEVASRRNRPAKPPLSRDAIVEEALRQVTADDGAAMSLRKVAAALDTGPASLYAYVHDLTELQALVLDRALADVTTGEPGMPWRERLDLILRSYVQTLAASPALARLAFGATAVGPHALRVNEAVLEVLADAGVDEQNAAWSIALLTTFVTAVAAEHAGGDHPAEPGGPVAQALDRVSPAEHPRVHAARTLILSGTGEERFTWSAEVLIQGILAHGTAGTPPRGAPAAS
ncbi:MULTISPECIES: TetR/AcrR family transcriptional regulator C-terminal domain-containing protein [Actinoplanes]|uniref:TetR/AcrR family transcriptional regulator n=1 Tax=Actinoplanes TaxID=1865 RepID=UPI0005F2FAC5|nr:MULTISPECIES: TetR/AcrR family transcriptional regulator C-terminal domain-containing protein [Actinoplanes]